MRKRIGHPRLIAHSSYVSILMADGWTNSFVKKIKAKERLRK